MLSSCGIDLLLLLLVVVVVAAAVVLVTVAAVVVQGWAMKQKESKGRLL
jgi:flagellar basal body-associated protein FliL